MVTTRSKRKLLLDASAGAKAPKLRACASSDVALNSPHLHKLRQSAAQILHLPLHVPQHLFSLAQAICSYGYFRLAPNKWTPSEDTDENHGVFERPLRYGRAGVLELSVHARIGQSVGEDGLVSLWVFLEEKLDAAHEEQVVAQVWRMVRKDLDLGEFHEKHAEAKERGFGRTFRSPSLFEDMIKTLTNCNVTWKRTIQMNQLLCQHVGHAAAFPTPEELAKVEPQWLKEKCKVGYRASWMVTLARQVVGGEVDLGWFEQPARTHKEIFAELLKIKGFAKFASYNVLQLLGYHDGFPFDTETVRLLKEKHGVVGSSKEALFSKAEKLYAPYRPYQFLAYWFDLWRNYEARAGCVSTFWQTNNEDYM